MKLDSNKVYLIAMVESLINGNMSTDLGTHVLEYSFELANINQRISEGSKEYLALCARLKNKKYDNVVWGNVYYKHLDDNTSFEESSDVVEDLKQKSEEEKMDFILKKENPLTRIPYAKSRFVSPKISRYFTDLKYYSTRNGMPFIRLAEKFPRSVSPLLAKKYEEIHNQTLDLKNRKKLLMKNKMS